MNLNQMARRNLMRNKRRTMITAFSVAFGVLLSVTFTGVGDYSYTKMINTGAAMGFGHLVIEPAGFNDTPGLDKFLTDADGLREMALGLDGVEAAFCRIMGQAMFAAGAKSVGGLFWAVDPGQETEEKNLFLRSIEKGVMFDDPNGRGVVVGCKMAEKLNLRLGKKVVFTVTDKNGELTSEVCRVTGIFRTGEDTADSTVALLPIGRLRQVLHYGTRTASLVTVLIKDQRRSGRLRNLLASTLDRPDIEVLIWKETQPELAGLITIDRAGNYLLQALAGLLIAAGIMNTMFMSVLERKREFGMMMAIGMSPFRLVIMVIMEGFWIGVTGLVLGMILTVPWYLFMNTTGIDLGSFVGTDYSAGGVLVDPVLKMKLFPESVIAILAAVFCLTILAGLFPAWRAGRIPVVESLHDM